MTAATARAALAGFQAALGEDPSDVEDLATVPVPLPARLPVDALAWAGVQAASLALARISGADPVRLDGSRIAAAYRSERHLRIDGSSPGAWSPLSGFWHAADGWVRTHGNYPAHAEAMRGALGLTEPSAEAAAERLAAMRVDAAVSAITAHGGLCVPTREERPAVDAALRLDPPIRLERIGRGQPVGLPEATAAAPLVGVRVLDLTRVIAGPVCTRTLALAGADVLRIDPPALPEFAWQHLDTGHGKRSALLDLEEDDDRARFDALLANADVVVLGYRPDGLSRLGLTPERLLATHPRLVVAQLSAWGAPDRRGFDSLVQAASGIAWIESVDGTTPGVLPAQALDHTAGYLLAAAIATALRRRAVDGGGWIAETSLRRVAADLLALPRSGEPIGDAPPEDPETQTFDVDGTEVRTVVPAVAWTGGPSRFAPPRPWGGDQAVWR
ncbi:CoA transferase [Microbacterium sp. ASV81]|uniref:CoA transferase n=1 Tax=Microbacterium capsulatum TaxID=3041921 RepID=A0ABU0XL46_9MICO|nr:CoA transferase [Microbacterium sp. ASV81]MDQ4215874.1 CoA transferase [Microbacterium sp. ASV81]